MLKRLRTKFTVVVTVLLVLLLTAILTSICHFTWISMDADAENAMQAVSMDPLYPSGPSHSVSTGLPCFLLSRDASGEITVSGSNYYDLSDTELLQQILDAAQGTGKTSGLLFPWHLRFSVRETENSTTYIFMDVTSEIHAMQDLVFVCALTLLCSVIVFFCISWWLSSWMVRPVDQAWKQQRQFVADASHELKTPLTVILTNADLLQSGEYTKEDERRFAGSIHTMALQMRGLVESLLELARIDTRPVQKQMLSPMDLSDLAENCVMTFEPVYFEAGRELESQIAPGIWVRGSQQHLRQVLDILLDNGQKYSTPGTRVEVQLQQNRRRCILRVRSLGQTMTRQQCRDIFKRFYRTDETRMMNRSYGLGLPIAHAIITQHRGKIGVQSKDGVNTFWVSLPLDTPPK